MKQPALVSSSSCRRKWMWHNEKTTWHVLNNSTPVARTTLPPSRVGGLGDDGVVGDQMVENARSPKNKTRMPLIGKTLRGSRFC